MNLLRNTTTPDNLSILLATATCLARFILAHLGASVLRTTAPTPPSTLSTTFSDTPIRWMSPIGVSSPLNIRSILSLSRHPTAVLLLHIRQFHYTVKGVQVMIRHRE